MEAAAAHLFTHQATGAPGEEGKSGIALFTDILAGVSKADIFPPWTLNDWL